VVFLALAAGAYFYARDFHIRTAYLDLLPQEDPLVREFKLVEQDLARTDVMAVLLTLTSPPADMAERRRTLEAAGDRVIAELDLGPTADLVSASYRVGEGIAVPPELLIFRTLSAAELERLQEIAREIQARMAAFPPIRPVEDVLAPLLAAEHADPAVVRAALAELAATGRASRDLLDATVAGQELLAEAARIAREVQSRPAPPEIGEPLLSRDGSRLVVQIWPSRPPLESLEFNRDVTAAVRGAIGRANLGALGVEAGITGMYTLTVEADDTIRQDMGLVTIISTAAVFVLLLLILRRPSLCLAAIVPITISALFIIAWAKLAVGGFNLLTVFLPALVIGLGDDFCIHILSRYVEERARGKNVTAALVTAVRMKGGAVTTAAMTIAAVFGCLLLSRSRALWEMGAIMGVGILFPLAGAFLLTPALVALLDRDRRPRMRSIASTVFLHSVYRRFLRLSPGVVAIGLILTGSVVYQASRVQFRFASRDLAPLTPGETVLAVLTREFAAEIWLGESFRFFVDRPEDIAPLEAALAAHPLVRSTVSVRDLLPRKLLGDEISILDLPVGEAQRGVADLEAMLVRWDPTLTALHNLIVQLTQLELVALLHGRPALAEALSTGTDDLIALLWELEAVDAPVQRARLERMAGDLDTLHGFVSRVTGLPPEPELLGKILALLPAEVRSQYVTRVGRYIVEARMSPDLLEGDHLRAFLDWADGLDVDRMGVPEITVRLEEHMKRDFFLSTALAVVLIFLLVWRDFPRPAEAVLALAPLGMGYVWMLAGMNLLGIRFNFTNIVISPLLIGIGVDSAVVLLHRIAEERAAGGDAVARASATSTVPIAFSSLTTMATFAALLVARTPGLRFLGSSALLGLGFTALWSLTFLPAAAALLVEKTKPEE
jgi:predicted exporter